MFLSDTIAHRTSNNESQQFLRKFSDLMRDAQVDLSFLKNYPKIKNSLNEFHKILNGRSAYVTIVPGKNYKKIFKSCCKSKKLFVLAS